MAVVDAVIANDASRIPYGGAALDWPVFKWNSRAVKLHSTGDGDAFDGLLEDFVEKLPALHACINKAGAGVDDVVKRLYVPRLARGILQDAIWLDEDEEQPFRFKSWFCFEDDEINKILVKKFGGFTQHLDKLRVKHLLTEDECDCVRDAAKDRIRYLRETAMFEAYEPKADANKRTRLIGKPQYVKSRVVKAAACRSLGFHRLRRGLNKEEKKSSRQRKSEWCGFVSDAAP